MIVLLAIFALVVAALLYRHFRKAMPSGWTAKTAGNDYGCKVDADGSFDFPQAPDSVHYVTKACGSLAAAKGLRLRYRIDADPGVTFHPLKQPDMPSIGPTLYFQRKGDDWSGSGNKEAYRWWATFAAPSPIVPGTFEITALFSDNWTAVETSSAHNNPQAFADALANAGRVGFTFGGGDGYGHGVYASGKARFTVLAFDPI